MATRAAACADRFVAVISVFDVGYQFGHDNINVGEIPFFDCLDVVVRIDYGVGDNLRDGDESEGRDPEEREPHCEISGRLFKSELKELSENLKRGEGRMLCCLNCAALDDGEEGILTRLRRPLYTTSWLLRTSTSVVILTRGSLHRLHSPYDVLVDLCRIPGC